MLFFQDRVPSGTEEKADRALWEHGHPCWEGSPFSRDRRHVAAICSKSSLAAV